MKTALTVPLLPSVTDTSLMEMVGGGGLVTVVNDQVKSAARGLPAASLTPLAPPLTLRRVGGPEGQRRGRVERGRVGRRCRTRPWPTPARWPSRAVRRWTWSPSPGSSLR